MELVLTEITWVGKSFEREMEDGGNLNLGTTTVVKSTAMSSMSEADE